jgi:hypothetical protein
MFSKQKEKDGDERVQTAFSTFFVNTIIRINNILLVIFCVDE